MQVRFGQQAPCGQNAQIQRQPRFGGEVTLQWHTVKHDIPVKFEEKTAQRPDGFVKSEIQQAIATVEDTFRFLNKTPQGAMVVLGKEKADQPGSIFSFFTTDFYKKTIGFLQYNPDASAQSSDQEAVTDLLTQTARHIRDKKVK